MGEKRAKGKLFFVRILEANNSGSPQYSENLYPPGNSNPLFTNKQTDLLDSTDCFALALPFKNLRVRR